MAIATLTQAAVYVGAVDVSGQVNQGSMMATADTQDATTFASGGYRQLEAVLRGAKASLAGFTDESATALAAYLGAVGAGVQVPVSWAIPGTTAGDPCHFTRGRLASFSPIGGKVGELAAMSADFEGDGVPEVRGVLLHPAAARTTTGNGTAVAQAGPSATQKLWAALHIVATSGTPTITVKIQSDDGAGFASPTDRITFTAATTTGWQVASVAGSFATETHLRAQWTISGGTPSVTFVVVAGLANII